MRIIGLAGWSGSGKTTLLDQGDPAPGRARAHGLDAQARASRFRRRPAGQGFAQPPHGRRDRGAGRLGEPLGADARVARRRRADAAGAARRKLAPVDLVLVEGFKREPHPEARSLSRGDRQAAAASRRSLHRRHRLRRAAAAGRACRWSISTTSRRSPTSCSRTPRRSSAILAHAERGLMAQLTDDCFAFSRAAAAGRRARAASSPSASRRWRRPRPCRSPPRAAACLRSDVVAPIDLPPFDNSAVDGYAVRHADLDAKADTRLTIVDRVTAGRAAARALARGRGDPHLHRRADAGRRRHRVHAGGCARRRRGRDRAAGA